MNSQHVCVDGQQPRWTQSSSALAPGVSREGMRGSNWKWSHTFECILWLRQSIKFLQIWISYVSSWPWFITETHTTSFSAPSDSPTEWQFFREVKVKRGTTWCLVIVFSLAVPRGDSRKWDQVKAWSLDPLSWGMLSVPVALHLGCGSSHLGHMGLPNLSLCCVVCWASPQLLSPSWTSSSDQRKGLEHGQSSAHPSVSSVARTRVGSLFANRRGILPWKSLPYGRKSHLCFRDARQQPAFVCNCLLRFTPSLVVASCSFIKFTWVIS